MDLILWRHAEAEDGGPDIPDDKRRLTPRGEKQARRVAKWFLAHRPKELRILVSPTERTCQTAQALGLPFEVDDRIGPGATLQDLITASGWPGSSGATMLVGHQPVLGQLAAFVLAEMDADWRIGKGALWWLARRSRGPDAESILQAAVSPDLVP